jgi:hypothetical protein
MLFLLYSGIDIVKMHANIGLSDILADMREGVVERTEKSFASLFSGWQNFYSVRA